MFRKYASATVLEATMGDQSFSKSAHRATFDHIPRREGYLYVRSRAISSRCNDNYDYFGPEEIAKAYRTFIGKPAFVNHVNSDHKRARGIIVDAVLHRDVNPDGSPDVWVECLHELDAYRYPKMAQAILAGHMDRTSMGADVTHSECSVCGNVATSPLQYCGHIPGKKGQRIFRMDPKTGQREGRLVFEICSGLSFFENSFLVEPPADPSAYVLGSPELGPGLNHLSAIQRTSSIQPTYNTVPIQRGSMPKVAARQYNPLQKVWDLIKEAYTTGDDLIEDYPQASTNMYRQAAVGELGKLGPEDEDHDYFKKTHGVSWERGVNNITSSFLNSHHAALHEHEETGQVGPAQETHHEGMNWYKEFHKTARMITGGKAVKGKNEVTGGDPAMGAGLLAVTSPQSKLPENTRKADLTYRAGHGLGGPSGLPTKPTKKVPDPGPPKPRDPHYHPGIMSTGDQAQKSNRILGVVHNGDHAGRDAPEPERDGKGNWKAHPSTPLTEANPGSWSDHPNGPEHHSSVMGLGSPKVSNFAHTIEHGGDDPKHVAKEAAQGRDGRRVTVDIHALSTYLGKRADQSDYNHVGGPPSKGYEAKGFRENHRYRQVADAYREASDRLRIHHGIHAEPHQVQAVVWVHQRNSNYEEDPGEKKTVQNASAKWNTHVEQQHPEFAHAKFWKMSELSKRAYGETKAPRDVDTLRAENCTVCGSDSSNLNGRTCNVCGFSAPIKPFGDPNTDVARDADLQKQVLDGQEADPNDPDQQLGNQMGDPEELEQQQSDADAGLDTQMQTLNCQNCGVGIQPATPATSGGEPPYPAEGDVCPVCKDGQLLSGGDEAAEEGEDVSNDPNAEPEEGEDEDQDGVPDDEESEDPGDETDDEDDFDEDPKKKVKKK